MIVLLPFALIMMAVAAFYIVPGYLIHKTCVICLKCKRINELEFVPSVGLCCAGSCIKLEFYG